MANGRRGRGRLLRLARPWHSAAGVLCLPVLVLAGCSGGSRVADNRDPIIGNQQPLPAESRGQIKPVPPASGAGVYPLPAGPNSATSTADLASRVPGQLSSGQNLRGGAAPAGNAGAATLGAPQVAKDGGSSARIQPIVPAGGPGIQSIDQGLQYLQSQGVQGFRLERQRDTGKWRCTCAIPRREAPNNKQIYDIQNADDPLSALRAVVEQVKQNAG